MNGNESGRELHGVAAIPRSLPTVPGVSYRKLDYWTTRGYLRANVANPGTGQRRTWPDTEIAVAELMARLTSAGLTVDAAHRVARGDVELGPGIHVVVTEAVETTSA